MCLTDIVRDSMAGTLAGTGLPIEIVSKNGDSVDVRFKQTWKSDSTISWMAVQFTDATSNSLVCSKKNEVSYGVVDYSSGSVAGSTYSNPIRVKCSAGIAKINIFVHDGSPPFKTQPVFTVPSMCYPSADEGNKIGHYYSVPCQECVTVLGAKPTSNPTKKPTKAPTKAPIKTPTKQPTKAPTKQPTKAPTKKPTTAPVKTPTKQPTKKPTKAPTKKPTKAPTKQPVKPPTKAPTKKPTTKPTVKVCPTATLVSQQGSVSYTTNPITIVPGSQTGTTVQFSVNQVWKSSSISWIAVRYTNSGGSITCPKEETVNPGVTDFCTGTGTVLTAKCSGGVASVTVYVHDGQFNGQPDITVPSICNPSTDASKKISYTFSVPCACA